ncbi:hypothetical protein Hanom_Chr10g00948241 [Helianthus anomalus]
MTDSGFGADRVQFGSVSVRSNMVSNSFGSVRFESKLVKHSTPVKPIKFSVRVTSVFRPPISSTHHTWTIGRLSNYVDVDDAWNLVGCLDTHLKRIVFILCYFIIHVVFCFQTL